MYLEAHALKSYLKRLRKKMGWPELTETYYEHLRQTDGTGAAPAAPTLRAAA